MEDCVQNSQNGCPYESCKAGIIEKTDETTNQVRRHQQQHGDQLVMNRDGNGSISNLERIAVFDVDKLQPSVDDSQKNEIPSDRQAEKAGNEQNATS